MQTQTKPRWPIVVWLIVSQLMAIATLLLWLVIAGLSVMAFDQGPSTEAWIFVGAVWAYPLIPLGLAVAAWVAFAFRKDALAAILSTITFLPPVLFYLFLWVTSMSWFIMQ